MCTGVAGDGVGQVRAGLAVLVAADVPGLPDEQIRSEVLDLLTCLNQLTGALLDRIAAFDRRDLAHGDAQRASSTWLVDFGRMSQGAALRWLSIARCLAKLPALADGARAGTVSMEQLVKVPEGAAAVQAAVDALMRPPGPGDDRTAAQRRVDAVVDLARGALAGTGLPEVGGERSQIGVLVTPEILFGTPDQTPCAERSSCPDPMPATTVDPTSPGPRQTTSASPHESSSDGTGDASGGGCLDASSMDTAGLAPGGSTDPIATAARVPPPGSRRLQACARTSPTPANATVTG